MKKKIKDLTPEEVEKICVKYDDCDKCPLDISYDHHCMKIVIKENKEYLEKEIEVEEE